MREQYTRKIETIVQAFEYLESLHDDDLSYHFDDDLNGIEWNLETPPSAELLTLLGTRTSEAKAIFDAQGIDIFVPANELHKHGKKILIWKDGNDVFYSTWKHSGIITSDSWGIDLGADSWCGDVVVHNMAYSNDVIRFEWIDEEEDIPPFRDWIEAEITDIHDEFLKYQNPGERGKVEIPTQKEAFGIYYEEG